MRRKKVGQDVRHRGCDGKLNFAQAAYGVAKIISNPRQENGQARLHVSPKILFHTISFILPALRGHCCECMSACVDRVISGLDLVTLPSLGHFPRNLRLLQMYKATVMEDVSIYNTAIG